MSKICSLCQISSIYVEKFAAYVNTTCTLCRNNLCQKSVAYVRFRQSMLLQPMWKYFAAYVKNSTTYVSHKYFGFFVIENSEENLTIYVRQPMSIFDSLCNDILCQTAYVVTAYVVTTYVEIFYLTYMSDIFVLYVDFRPSISIQPM